MGGLDRIKQRLISKYGSQKSTLEQHVNAPATEVVEQNQYVKNVQEVYVEEEHEVEIRQIVQPILDEQVMESDVLDKVQPSQYKEIVRDLDVDAHQRRHTNNDTMVSLGSHRVADDIIEERQLEPVVQQRKFRHVIETIQPVIQRRIVRPHVINEIVPVFQKQIIYRHVNDLQYLSPITMKEYVTKFKKGDHADMPVE